MPRPPRLPPVPFRELLDSLLAESRLLGRSPETDRHYRGVAKHVERWARERAPHVLRDLRTAARADFEAYLLWRRDEGAMWSSLRSEWNCLRAILRQAVWDERLAAVPQVRVRWEAKIAEDRRAGRSPERGHRVLELVPLCLEAADRLVYFRDLDPTLPALFRFLAYTGARSGEVLVRAQGPERLGLRWRDLEGLDTQSPVAVIHGGKGRARGSRRIPIPGPAADALRGLERLAPEDFVWGWVQVTRAWHKVRRSAAELASPELAPPTRTLRLHDLRHFASHYWRSRGVPDRLIDRLLGHRTPVIAQRYAAADEREVGEACARALVAAPPEPRPDDRGGLDVPDIITIDFDYWHRRNGSAAAGGGD